MTTILDNDISFQEVQSLLKASPVTAIVAVASFVPKCQIIVKQLQQQSESLYPIYILQTDESDGLEEIAVNDLNLKDIPSWQIYHNGTLVTSHQDIGGDVTADGIQEALTKVAAAAADKSCPTPAVACCPPGSSMEEPPNESSDVLRLVMKSYANTVTKQTTGCCVSGDAKLNGYNADDLRKAGASAANLGLGCGNPLSFSKITEGETVVDLGSGAGVDCFLASEKVGTNGRVIGVDMTPDMIYTARQNAKTRLVSSNRHDNVQFRLSEIEYLPIANNTVDCVISNCVINLSPDKAQVYREIYRILKPGGGRIAISDVIHRPEVKTPLPDHLKTAEALAC